MRPHKALPVLCLVLAVVWAGAHQIPTAASAHETERIAVEGSRAAISPQRRPPAVGAKSAVLVDASDGQVLWEKDSHRRRAMASTAKILTALVVLEKTKPRDVVTASPRAEAVGDGDPLVTQLNLKAGEQLTVEQLLYGLLLPSANDAAVALAEHVAGSVERFADLMNDKARKLGAKDSHFTTPNGLDDPRQYSSAYDLALFTRAALRVAAFRKIVGTRSHSIPATGSSGPRPLENRNQLLGRFPGAIGVKTGQTVAAGKSLVGAAKRGREERIAVVLASPDPVSESGELLDYGLTAFRRFQLAEKARRWGEITYGDGTTARLVALRNAGKLVPASRPNPRVFYDPQRRILSADLDPVVRVPVKVRCLPRACRLLPARPPRLLPALVSILAPLLSLAR